MGADSTPFLTAARALLDRLAAQTEALDRASRICAEAIGEGGFVHAFGTGHSRIPVEELSMTFHTQVVGANGQRQAMFIERVEGLAEAILDNFELVPPDAMLVFSHGGTTAVPV